MTFVHSVSETAEPVTSDGLLVAGEDMGAAKLQGEKGVQRLPKGCLAKPRLSGSVFGKKRPSLKLEFECEYNEQDCRGQTNTCF